MERILKDTCVRGHLSKHSESRANKDQEYFENFLEIKAMSVLG